MNVDHNHTTGKIRGILCHSCNVIIGKIECNHSNTKGAKQHHYDWIVRDGA